MKRKFVMAAILFSAIFAVLWMFAAPGMAQEGMGAAELYGLSGVARGVTFADFNGDGKLDAAVAMYDGNVQIFLNNGTGYLNKEGMFSIGSSPFAIATGDFNNDGKIDICAANSAINQVTVILNSGNGIFGGPGSTAVSTAPQGVATADFNKDGKLDIIVTLSSSNSFRVLRGNGDGTFTPQTVVPSAGTTPIDVITGDFNGDTWPDAAYICNGTDYMEVSLNNGAGILQSPVPYTSGVDMRGITKGDFDGDGDLDIVTTGYNGQCIFFFRNNGAGTFTSSNFGVSPGFPIRCAAGDFDADGKLDVMVTGTSSLGDGVIYIMKGDGTGNFAKQNEHFVGNDPNYIAAGDTNGDGQPEIMFSENTGQAYGIIYPSGPGSYGISTHAFINTISDARRAAVGDFNNDGKLDVAICGQATATFKTYFGNGAGNILTPTIYGPAGMSSATKIKAAFMNGDANIDIVVLDKTAGKLFVFLNNGSGSFAAPSTYPLVTVNPEDFIIADINGDGKMDVITVHPANDMIEKSYGDGSGGFTAGGTISCTNPYSAVFGDFNNDGKKDFVVVNLSLGYATVRMGNNDGTFAAPVSYAVCSSASVVNVGDLNNDGKQDIVVSNGSQISILLNTGTGAFGAATTFTVQSNIVKLELVDLNKDGNLEIIAARNHANHSTVMIFVGDGTGVYSMNNMTEYSADRGLFDVVPGDFDNNYMTDLVTVGNADTTVSVIRNLFPPPGPVITALTGTPVSGTYPLTVTFTASAVASSAPISVCEWDFNGDNVVDLSGATPGTPSYTFNSAGTYIAKLKVGDSNGKFTVAALTITVSAPASKIVQGKIFIGTTGISGIPIYAFKLDGTAAQSTTSGTGGAYSLTLSSGAWSIQPQPSIASGYIFPGMPPQVFFTNDSTSETKLIDIALVPASAKITGTLLPPYGTLPYSSIYLFANTASWVSAPASPTSSGTFEIIVPAGTYNLYMAIDPAAGVYWTLPAITPITVNAGQTYNIGNIQLVAKTIKVSGQVFTTSNTLLPNATVVGIQIDGQDIASATSDSSGAYQLTVNPGTYLVIADGLSTGQDYYMQGAPQTIIVTTSSSNIVNFTMVLADSTITGSIMDESNNKADIFGAVGITQGKGDLGFGGVISNGDFSFKVPAGTYTIYALLPPGSDYTPSAGVSVSVASGSTATQNISVLSNNATISGHLQTSGGTTITGVDAEVFVTNNSGALQSATVDTTTGYYSIKVAAGTWYIGHYVNPNETGYIAIPGTNNAITIGGGGAETHNIVIQAADCTINGSVKKPDGTAFGFIWVSANISGEGGASGAENEFVNGIESDENGEFTLKVPAGTYTLSCYGAASTGYINPEKVTVVLASGGTDTAVLQFREPNSTITGIVKYDGNAMKAYVSAWSYDGGHAETFSSETDGSYSLSVSRNSKWRIRAVYEEETFVYDSSPCGEDVEIGDVESVSFDMELEQNENLGKPESKSLTFDSTRLATLKLDDGTTVIMPANSIDTGGNVTVTASPHSTVPRQLNSMPLGFAYQFKAYDSTGQEIKGFNSSVMIVIPYSPTLVEEAGVTVEDLIPCYWDEQTDSWRKLGNVVVDKDNNTITITTSHFTDYSLNSTAQLAFTAPETAAGSGYMTNYGGGGSGCFLATSAFEKTKKEKGGVAVKNFTGKYVVPSERLKKLNDLRKFRDEKLLTNKSGRQFVRLYYTLGPVAAEAIRGNEPLKALVRSVLLPDSKK